MTANRIYISLIFACIFSGCRQEVTQDHQDFVQIDTVAGLVVYTPSFTRLELRFEDVPAQSDSNIVFCCGAAFTKTRSLSFSHDNIGGTHVSNGQLYEGYDCKDCDGAFTYVDGKWAFVTDSIREMMSHAAINGGMGFCQMMLRPKPKTTERNNSSKDIFSFKYVHLYRDREGLYKFRRRYYQYRALCEYQGKLCVAELLESGTFSDFERALDSANIEKAIYLDTGIGWGHAWYRRTKDDTETIHSYLHPFVSNWLVFIKSS